jgi:hypothetical protein
MVKRANRRKKNKTKIRKTKKTRQRRSNRRNQVPAAATAAGEGFLKAAFAAPDFENVQFDGIPDAYTGDTLTRMDGHTVELDLTSTTDDVFVVVAPTPGVAFWFCNVPRGTYPTATTVWHYDAVPGYFGSGGLAATIPVGGDPVWTDALVTAFRYAGLAAEVRCTSSVQTTSGAISVWHAPLTFQACETATGDMTYMIGGLEATGTLPSVNYTARFLDGAYAVAGTTTDGFPFKPVVAGLPSCPPPPYTGATLANVSYGELAGPVCGVGDVHSVVFKVPGSTTSSTNAGYLKVWHVLEYLPNPTGGLAYYATPSPMPDCIAIEQYARIVHNLPIAVRAKDNADFWRTVLSIVRDAGAAMAFIPGPWGLIAGSSSVAAGAALSIMGK